MFYRIKMYISGTLKEVAVEAPTEEQAVYLVKKQVGEERAIIFRVEAVRKSFISGLSFFKKVKPRELALLTKNLNILLRSGITTLEAVETVAGQTDNKRIKKAMMLVAENIREGFSLRTAFGSSPNVFPDIFVEVISAAEEAGMLEKGLELLTTHFEKEAFLKEKLKQAVSYPAIVLIFAVIVALGLFIFVVPKFAQMLTEAEIPLPFATKIMFYFSQHVWIVLGMFNLFAAGLIKGLQKLWNYRPSRLWFERILIKIPFVGQFITKTAASRVIRTLALLIDVGIPVINALEIAERNSPLLSLKDELKVVKTVVRSGGSLSGALNKCRWLPPPTGRMSAIGERSGNLPEMLERAARLYDSEIDSLIQRLPPIVEGGMVILVGGIVFFVLLSLFLPIFSVYQTIK